MRNRTISNRDDIIDSRDVIARIEELEAEREALAQAVVDASEARNEEADEEKQEALADELNGATAALEDFDNADEDGGGELKALQVLQEEAEGYAPDWRYGEALIRASYFEAYARDRAEDLGAIQRGATWPNNHIDREAAANALKQDYTCVEFDGVDYWIRS